MGEIADAMINGEMCRYCGTYLHDQENIICEYGFEVSCEECAGKDDQFVHCNEQGRLIKYEELGE
jgi:hypothetical protein